MQQEDGVPAHTHTHCRTQFRQTDVQTHTHTLAHMHSVVRGGGGDFRAFTGRAGVRLSEPWTAHMKLIQCGLLSSVHTGSSISVWQ